MTPERSYIVWFSQRVGSTLLTQALEDTDVAGRPREWLETWNTPGLLARYGVKDADALRAHLWEKGTTANGVFAVKYGMTADLHRDVTAVFSTVLGDEPDPDGRKAWEAFFPRCQHIFMTRRDKLRLAVSWWRAIRSAEWHRPNRPETVLREGPWAPPPRPSADELLDQYDRNAIRTLFVGANLREADMQQQFDRWGIAPHTIVYEDFIASYAPTIRAVLAFLQVPDARNVPIPPPAFDCLADQAAESWYQRFRLDLDAGA